MYAMLSPPILDQLGVNQGGNASPTLFRTHLADLGVVLISDSEQGLQKQLNGLQKICSKNLMIVNKLKTKVLIFGSQLKANVHSNGKT